MTDPAATPTSDDTSLTDALRELDLPGRLLEDTAADPDHAGALLLGFVAELGRAGHITQARRLLEIVRAHPPAPEDHQHASVELARILRGSQDEGDAAEAERITAELLRSGHLEEGPAQLLGEDLQETERWEESLRCHNIAGRQLLAAPPEELADEDDLSLAPLVSRLLARMKLGLTRDAHDEVAVAVVERQMQGVMDFPEAGGEDRPEEDGPVGDVETLYSREAFDEARARGLLMGEETAERGADAYYRAAERTLREREHEQPGTRWRVVLHGVEEIAEFAERSGLDPAESATALTWVSREFAANDPRSRAWPPERNQACWCASGRKYKKCCGSPSNR